MDEKKEEQIKKDIQRRLRRIEGQVKGIHGMVDKNVCCSDVLIQVAAVKSAINKVGALMIENYARNCMGVEAESETEQGLESLIKVLNTFIK